MLHKGIINDKEREVIKLLQKKEMLIINNERDISITSNNGVKRVTFRTFFNLVNKGLLDHQKGRLNSYELSDIGKQMKTKRPPQKNQNYIR